MARVDYEGWMAEAYDAGRALSPTALDAWREAAGPYLPGPGGVAGVVVDLGGGTGRFSGELARWTGGTVVTVEAAAAMALRARRKAMPGVVVAVGRAEAIPLGAGSAGAVWMSQVVHHLDDLDAAARELRRVLRPGGRLLIRGEFGPDDGDGDGAVDGSTRSGFAVYRWFPAAAELAGTFPSRRTVVGALGGAGFVPELATVVEQQTAGSLRELHARLATRADSTLAAIDAAAFDAGLAELEAAADAEAAAAAPTPVIDRLGFTVFRLAG
jgi:SAM-dependent methyltransferase